MRQELVEAGKILPYQNREMQFGYAHQLVTNDKHLWLPVECEGLLQIRQALGLPAQPLVPLHLTVAVMPGGEHAVSPGEPN
jgi:hypothetical protein